MNKISDFEKLKKDVEFSYDKDIEFFAVAPSEDTYDAPMLFYLLDINYLKVLEKHKYNIAGIICPQHISDLISDKYDTIITNEPKTLFFLIHNNLKETEQFETIIEEGCEISSLASISKYNTIIKSGTKIAPFVYVSDNVVIGHNCYIGPGAVIGVEGFNIYQLKGENKLVKHHGPIIIEDNVVILSNATVEKAIYGHSKTLLEKSSMVDNLVNIGHDAIVKRNAELAAGTIIAGYSIVGESTFMGINSSLQQFAELGSNNKIGMSASVNRSTKSNQVYAPAQSSELSKARIKKHLIDAIVEYIAENPEKENEIIENTIKQLKLK